MKETSSKCPQKAQKGPHLNEHVHVRLFVYVRLFRTRE